jgi:hypothetical protein
MVVVYVPQYMGVKTKRTSLYGTEGDITNTNNKQYM